MVFTKEDCIYENITKKFVYCGFYFCFLVIVKNEKTKKTWAYFLFSSLTLLLQLRVRDVQEETQLYYFWNTTVFLQECLVTFWATNTLNFSNLTFPKPAFPTYA